MWSVTYTYSSRAPAFEKKKDKGTNNDLQNTTKKSKDPVTPTPLTPVVNANSVACNMERNPW
jgi:hypothetical protein